MPTPLNITISLKGHLPIYIEYDCVPKTSDADEHSTTEGHSQPQESELDNITNVLMKKSDHFVAFKTESGKNNFP